MIGEFIAKVSYITKLDVMIYGCYTFSVRSFFPPALLTETKGP